MVGYGTDSDNIDQIRKWVGNPPTSELSDADIQESIDQARSSIDTDTGKNDWASTDRQFRDIVYAQNKRAAAIMLDNFTSENDHIKAQDFFKEYYARIRSVNKGQPDSSPPIASFVIKSSSYASEPLASE